MHQEVIDFFTKVKGYHPEHFKNKHVLEAGSLNINGSVRSFFDECAYIGIDLNEGLGVDIVSKAMDYKAKDGFGVVVTSEMLEHDRTWKESLLQLYDNLTSGGLMVITCAGPTREEHGTAEHAPDCSPFTNDYYLNLSIEDISQVLTIDMFTTHQFQYGRDNGDLYFYGIKK